MRLPRLAVAVAVMLGLLASSAQASGTVALDGTRRNRAEYIGSLTQPALRLDTTKVPTSLDPVPADCTPASCDITALKLSLPKGSTAGRFAVEVTAGRELNISVALYDSKGAAAGEAGLTALPLPECCETVSAAVYKRGFVVKRLAAGQYTLVIYNRGGSGGFLSEVQYRAHPPDRPRKGKA